MTESRAPEIGERMADVVQEQAVRVDIDRFTDYCAAVFEAVEQAVGTSAVEVVEDVEVAGTGANKGSVVPGSDSTAAGFEVGIGVENKEIDSTAAAAVDEAFAGNMDCLGFEVESSSSWCWMSNCSLGSNRRR